MHFAKSLFVAASLATSALAKIAFTTLPTAVTAGKATTLTWGGGDGTPVTITLQQGTEDNLQTVSIITGKATGDSYTWTPSKSLADGDNYALKISQGLEGVNYSGMFTLSGGSKAVASVTAAASTSASAAISQIISGSSGLLSLSSSLHLTGTTTIAGTKNATVVVATPHGTGAVGTGAVGSSGLATGTALHRNTTMSHATLKTTKSHKTSTKPASTTATVTSSSGGSSSTTAAAATTKKGTGATTIASPLAFVLCAFVAMVYLG